MVHFHKIREIIIEFHGDITPDFNKVLKVGLFWKILLRNVS